jgi:hypothetical protein
MANEHTIKKPGDTIDSWCGKCKRILAHTIEALVQNKPARVSCNTCRAQHGYKADSPKTTQKPTSGVSSSKPAKARVSRYEALLKDGVKVMTYSISEKYQEGDVVQHATFGRGAVTEIKDGNKIEVLFESGTKTLIHDR